MEIDETVARFFACTPIAGGAASAGLFFLAVIDSLYRSVLAPAGN